MKKGCGGRYCWGNRGPGEGVVEVPAAAPGWQGSWAGRRSSRLGMGCRAVRGVLLRGRGGLLWPRLMTGMCGGRGEGEEHGGREAEEEAGGASGQGEVLAGAGSSGGGGEDRAGQDPPADPAGALGLPSPAPNPTAASVSTATGSGVAVGVPLSCDGSSCSAPSSRCSSPSEDVSARGGLPASAVLQDGGEAEEEGEERG